MDTKMVDTKPIVETGDYLYILKAELATPISHGNRKFSYSKHALHSPRCVRVDHSGEMEIDLPDGQTRRIPAGQLILWDVWGIRIPELPVNAVRFTPVPIMLSDIAGHYWSAEDGLVATLTENGQLNSCLCQFIGDDGKTD